MDERDRGGPRELSSGDTSCTVSYDIMLSRSAAFDCLLAEHLANEVCSGRIDAPLRFPGAAESGDGLPDSTTSEKPAVGPQTEGTCLSRHAGDVFARRYET